MNYAILAGGPMQFVPEHDVFKQNDVQWIGVDRGTYHLLKRGIKPIHAFGDFDSVTEQERIWMMESGITMSSFLSEKDQTDLEISINWALDQCPNVIYIFGATGGRADHSLMNIQLLIKGLEKSVQIVLIDKQNMLEMKQPGSYLIENNPLYKYLSFIPFSSKIENLTLTGVKYPLDNETLKWGNSLCISNEIVDEEASYSFTNGTIIVIRSHD